MVEESQLGRWPISTTLSVQWGEMDSFNHVNNTVYLRWFETARMVYFEKLELEQKLIKDNIGPILARATVDFKIPIKFPDTVTVKATVSRFGKTSMVMEYKLFCQSRPNEIAAQGDCVIVFINYKTGQKVLIDENTKNKVYALEMTAT